MASPFPESDTFPNQPMDPALCNFDICPLSRSIFRYQPNLAMAIVPLALFVLLTVGHIISGWRYKTWTYTVSILIGLFLELAGYVGRILANDNPFLKDYYLLQIVVLTCAPVLFCAAIYICLGRIVVICGPEMSRLRPTWYTPIFLTCDVVSLALQGAGGALTSTADDADGRQQGINIMLGGLSFQVATIAIFGFLFLEFLWRTHASHKVSTDIQNASFAQSKKWTAFLWSLGTATMLILIRSIYRVAEMAGGYDGKLMKDENTFLVFEGILIVVAVLLLLVFHPGAVMDEFGRTAKPRVTDNTAYKAAAWGSSGEEGDSEMSPMHS
ncbi:phospholipid-translocating ATPase rsb1 [Pseudogymnoascus australis]